METGTHPSPHTNQAKLELYKLHLKKTNKIYIKNNFF